MDTQKKAPAELTGAKASLESSRPRSSAKGSLPDNRAAYAEAGKAHREALGRMVDAWRSNRERSEDERLSPADWAVFSAGVALTASWSRVTDRKAQRKDLADWQA